MHRMVQGVAKALVALVLGASATLASAALKCDADGNGRIDSVDLTLIRQAAGRPATGADDPRDGNSDGEIDVADVRYCQLRCKYAQCASNGAPLADAGPDQTVAVGTPVTLNGRASADPDGDPLTYRWTLTARPAGSAAALVNANTVAPGFTVDRAGSYTITLVVNDGKTDSALDSVVISTLNSAPVAKAGPDQTAFVGNTVTLDGRGSNDVDGDPLTYAWRVLSAPTGSTSALVNPTVVQPQFTIDRAGSYSFELIVSDGRASSAPASVRVSTLNSAPVARAGNDRSVALGALVQLDGSASSDVDGDTLSFAWSLTTRPAGSAAALSSTTAVKPSFTADLPGTYVAQLIVNDGQAASAPATVAISTNNAAPSANAGPDQSVPLGARVTLVGSGSRDPEGAPLGYAWSFTSRAPGSAAVLGWANTASPQFTADKPGSYVVQLIVNDGTLASVPDTVVVSTLNSRPVADAGAAQNVLAGATVALDGSASRDADGDALTYSWSLTVKPAGSAAVVVPATAVNPGFVADLAGQYVAQLIVSDGKLASAPATVSVTATQPNRPPVAAASATPASVATGATVSLSAAGSSDPDGNPISYSWTLAARPAGSNAAVTNPTAANASFVPDVAGAYTVQLTVSDGSLSATALASVTATSGNRAPQFTSLPGTQATVDSPYAYPAAASDPDAGDTLTFSLVNAPQGMGVNPTTGLVSWLPTVLQTGPQSVRLRVTDAGGLFAEQAFTVTVGATPTPLTLAAALNPTAANAGQAVALTVVVSGGNGGAITRTATLDGNTPIALDGAGNGSFAAPAAGVHHVLVSVQQAPVNGAAPAPQTRDLILTVRDATDTTAPVAAITSPAANSEVSAAVPVIGTASDAHLAYYQLLMRPAGSSTYTEFWRGLANVTNGTLGTLDPTRIANGMYELALNVVDVNGRATSTVTTFEVARDLKLGQFRLSFADIRSDAPGMPLMLTRTYDSLKKDQIGDFGYGWSAAAQDVSLRKNVAEGALWNVQTSGFNICFTPAVPHRLTVSLPDGGVYRFQARNEVQCAFATVPDINVVYDALALPVGGNSGGAASSGKLEIINTSLLLQQGGTIFDVDTGGPWDPTDYKFTAADGTVWVLRKDVGVISQTDIYGNTINYGPGGYQHSATLAISLTRDGQGRITRATDPTGKSVAYTYNANGELATMTDRVGGVTSFFYGTTTRAAGAADSGSTVNAHLLESIVDPRGQVIARLQFDDLGRLSGSLDALAQGATQTFDTTLNQQRSVDRRGNPTTYTFDSAGNVTKIVDALGGTTELTYDANGNELTRKDPLGNVVTKTYDAAAGTTLTETDALGRKTTTAYVSSTNAFERQNPVSVTDPRGNVTSYAYPPGLDKVPGAVPSTITEPLGRVTSMSTDIKGNLVSLSVGGISTSYGYDGQGHRTSETDSLGSVTTYTYDANGNELTRSVTRTVNGVPRTETRTRVYDGNNRVVQETDPTGAVRKTTYNGAGKVETSTDALNRVTRYAYDANARLTRTDYPDGSFESIEYDANGNETARTDRSGRTTRKVYDALDRLVQTTLPDGSKESREYDAAGRMTAMVSATGGRTINEYDAADQLTATTDASGRRTQYAYDASGNRTRTTLPDGRQINYTYDALNRLTETLYADGSRLTTVYRADSRKASETDPRGVTTTFGYDAKGQLTSVVQSGVATATAYAYDQTGAKTTQTDAKSHPVRWVYDRAGRPISRTLPDGATESFEYDSEGRLTAHVTFAGQRITSTYDALGRELTRNIAATASAPARSISWTYDGEGRRLTQTESGTTSSQGTTTYRYDAQGRLVEQATPQGTLAWAYDAAGRVTERTTSEGTSRYAYDAEGRLTQLTAPDGKTTTYAYDAAGRNTQSVQQLSAGVELVTDRRYDAQDRQVAIAHSKRVGATKTLVAGQAVGRGAGGAVNRLDTFDGSASFNDTTGAFGGNPARVQTFGYDANARLTQENEYKGAELLAWLGNNTLPSTQATTYAYDAVGNRTTKTVVTGAGTETTVYAYDVNDRLSTETLTTTTGSTVQTSYTWDGNGNLQSKSTPSEYTGYVFDADNRLVEVRKGASQATATTLASYGYDGDGQRIRKSSGGTTTTFLIDTTATWPQVVLETAKDGSTTQDTAYVWGNELRLQVRGGQGTLFGNGAEALAPAQGHLGTVTAAIGVAGSPVESYESDAFGLLAARPAPLLNHQFGGEQLDVSTGLIYLRERWYEPRLGVFESPDRLLGTSTRPASLNRYAYAAADPVNRFDPSGNEDLLSLSIGSSAEATLQTGSVQSFRFVLQKAGCYLLEAVAEEVVTEGIYILAEAAIGAPIFYAGQSVDIERRLAEHAGPGSRHVAKDIVAKFHLDKALGKDAYRIAEQFIMDAVRASGGKLDNAIEAINRNRGRLRGQFLQLCK